MSYNFYDFLVNKLESLLEWAKIKRSYAYNVWVTKYLKGLEEKGRSRMTNTGDEKE